MSSELPAGIDYSSLVGKKAIFEVPYSKVSMTVIAAEVRDGEVCLRLDGTNLCYQEPIVEVTDYSISFMPQQRMPAGLLRRRERLTISLAPEPLRRAWVGDGCVF